MRKKVLIQRLPSRDDGTLGNVTVDGVEYPAFRYSLELSDRGNAEDISCILPGFYILTLKTSSEHGLCWHVLGPKGRSGVLIHPLNLAGNTEQGYAKQALGCIGLGSGIGIFKAGERFHVEGPHGPDVEALTRDQRGITGSKDAVAAFCALMGTEDADLEIRAAVGAV